MEAVAQKLTAEEFWLLPDNGMRRALVRGEVIETLPPGASHGGIAGEMVGRLRAWAKSGPGGWAGVESGFILTHGPDTVRGPDVSYVRRERIPPEGVPEKFWDLAPDLAVEVISPSETAMDVREKLREYFDAGTPMVWFVYPRQREVVVHTPDGVSRTYGGQSVLEVPDLLPGFRCVVAELFD
jgi:Uma2 family endonuclease